MSKSEVVFRVTDKAGSVHLVKAVKVLGSPGVDVVFTDAGGEKVAMFDAPVAVALCSAVKTLELDPGMTYEPVRMLGEALQADCLAWPRSFLVLGGFMALSVTIGVVLKAYELFWFVG